MIFCLDHCATNVKNKYFICCFFFSICNIRRWHSTILKIQKMMPFQSKVCFDRTVFSYECHTNHCLECTVCYFDRIYTTHTLQMPFKDICCSYNIAYTILQYCLYNILKVQTSSTSYKYKLLSVPFHFFDS